jgi:hypothetical protein
MLIKPVQRITKYPLLFDDLLSLTTPVHPDYFMIRRASEMAKSLAREIDELKRRKDVVASAIGGRKSFPIPSPNKEVGRSGKGLKIFTKSNSKNGTQLSFPLSKSISRTPTSSSTSTDTSLPPELSLASMEDLGLLVRRVEEAEAITKRLGREIVLWTAGVRESWNAMLVLGECWERVTGLGEVDEGRVGVWKGVVEVIVDSAWGELVSP